MCVFPSPDSHSASEFSLEEGETEACVETSPFPLLQREAKEVGEVCAKARKTSCKQNCLVKQRLYLGGSL